MSATLPPASLRLAELFSIHEFHEGILHAESYTDFIRDFLRETQTRLNNYVLSGGCVVKAVHQRAWLVDQVLIYLWCKAELAPSASIALIAVGGYGRGELHPYSDIDLLLLVSDEENTPHQHGIELFLKSLWDIGLNIGHSVRTIQECVSTAEKDITIATALQETRLIAGPSELIHSLNQNCGADSLWPSVDFFKAKTSEQKFRHNKHNNTEYNLEPDIKNAPGGLRDIQTVGWVAKRHFGVATLQELIAQNFLSEAEYSILDDGQTFLWELRYHLHILTGRGENRLLFDYQTSIAKAMGYTDNETSLAIEQLMKAYYRAATSLAQVNEVLLQIFNELFLENSAELEIIPIDQQFQLANGAIEVTHPEVFSEHPSALLKIFYIIANRTDIIGMRAATIRLIHSHRHLINTEFRTDPQNNEIFLNFLRSPHNIFQQLKCMKRYGILGRYIPAFGDIIGQSQFDLFHIYTVDAHTLLVIKNMRQFYLNAQHEKLPIACRIMQQLPKLEILYLAGLFHDIAKGRGGDHSKLGAKDAIAFSKQHGLSHTETQLLIWLVQSHLIMSMTAQKKDLSDPEVIRQFAEEVGDEMRLEYLYVLTVADICATNPALWTSWRASLMRTLYRETKRLLRRGLDNPVDSSDRIQDNRNEALKRLALISKIDLSKEARVIWDNLGDDYFTREAPHDIAWHTQAIIQHPSNHPLILIQKTSSRKFEGGTHIFIYTEDHPNLFAVIAAVMEQLRLSIVDARIITSRTNFSLDTYIVLDEDGTPLDHDNNRFQHIRETLEEALIHPHEYPSIVTRRIPRQLKNFAPNTDIKLHNNKSGTHSILEVNTLDRPGVLAQVGLALSQLDISVINARITTLGERAEDLFFVTDKNALPFADTSLGKKLKKSLCITLNAMENN